MARSQKLALQLNMYEAIPLNIVPNTKPSGFPALKHANAAFFLLLGRSYITPSKPCAAGTPLAVKSPMTPLRTSRVMGSLEKPAAREKTAKKKSEPTMSDFRPKRSAILPKKRRNAPPASLCYVSYRACTIIAENRHTTKMS